MCNINLHSDSQHSDNRTVKQAQNRASSLSTGLSYPASSHHQPQPPNSTVRAHIGPFSALRSKLRALSEEERFERERDAVNAQARLDAALVRRDRDAAEALKPPSGKVLMFGQAVGLYGLPEELRHDEAKWTALYNKETTQPSSEP